MLDQWSNPPLTEAEQRHGYEIAWKFGLVEHAFMDHVAAYHEHRRLTVGKSGGREIAVS